MYRLIGPNVLAIHGGLPDALGEWDPPVAILNEPFPELSWLADSGKGKVIVRLYPDDSRNPRFNDPMNVKSVADGIRQRIDRYIPKGFGYDWVQPWNEPVVNHQGIMRMAELECTLMEWGYRITIGNFAVGNPAQLALWNFYGHALQCAVDHRSPLLLHQYWWKEYKSDPWLEERDRLVYEGKPVGVLNPMHEWKGINEDWVIPCVVGELGADIGVERPGVRGGYMMNREYTGADYLQDLDCWSRAAEGRTWVKGGAVFCYGQRSHMWWSYDLWDNRETRDFWREAKPLYRRWTWSAKSKKSESSSEAI